MKMVKRTLRALIKAENCTVTLTGGKQTVRLKWKGNPLMTCKIARGYFIIPTEKWEVRELSATVCKTGNGCSTLKTGDYGKKECTVTVCAPEHGQLGLKPAKSKGKEILFSTKKMGNGCNGMNPASLKMKDFSKPEKCTDYGKAITTTEKLNMKVNMPITCAMVLISIGISTEQKKRWASIFKE